jgi:hypothetical protein
MQSTSAEGPYPTPVEKLEFITQGLTKASQPAQSSFLPEGYHYWYNTWLSGAIEQQDKCIPVANEQVLLSDPKNLEDIAQRMVDEIVARWQVSGAVPNAPSDQANTQTSQVPTSTPVLPVATQPPAEPQVTTIYVTQTPQATPTARVELSVNVESEFTNYVGQIEGACDAAYSGQDEAIKAACGQIYSKYLFEQTYRLRDNISQIDIEAIAAVALNSISGSSPICGTVITTNWDEILSGQSELWQTSQTLFASGSYGNLSVVAEANNRRVCALVTDSQHTFDGGIWQTKPYDVFARSGSTLGKGVISMTPPSEALNVTYIQNGNIYLYPVTTTQ